MLDQITSVNRRETNGVLISSDSVVIESYAQTLRVLEKTRQDLEEAHGVIEKLDGMLKESQKKSYDLSCTITPLQDEVGRCRAELKGRDEIIATKSLLILRLQLALHTVKDNLATHSPFNGRNIRKYLGERWNSFTMPASLF
jgi:hypothetical protein